MNFTKLIEDGTYSKKDLSPERQAYVSGMEYVMQNVLDSWADGAMLGFQTSSETLNKIQEEVIDATVEDIKQYLYVEICECIVCFCDEEAYEEEQGENK